MYEFRGRGFRELGRQLDPPIGAKQAKESVRLLERLGLVRRDDTGRYVLADAAITTGPEWNSLAIRSFQEETLAIAREALGRHPREVRDISTVTMNIRAEDFRELQEKIARFRSSVIQHVNQCAGADRVYQLNIQLVPLSRTMKKGPGK
jgi:uncharacterized protein (TIGR02147 family)